MSSFRTLWKCTFSPRLFKIYEVTWKAYEPQSLESWGHQVVVSFAAIWSISLYAIPLVASVMYQRNYSLIDAAYSLSRLATGAGAILIFSLAARGCSRANNPVYLQFIKTLDNAYAHYNADTKQELHKYDFEFWAWPVDFKIAEVEGGKSREKLTLEKIANANGRLRRQTGKEYVFALPCKFISYVVAHTVAIKLMYPGSAPLMNWALSNTLLKGRIDLIMEGAERFKVVTADKNAIDTIFIDKRGKSTNGYILVICCEGNCGFYETGIVSTPLNKGYSVLGWNHPGFGYSTGAPYPSQEENAIDCVMRFAIDRLKFPENKIILYGWSIGGYPATWAAMNYPLIHSLVLDATFDDVLPLAIMTMSSSLEGLVRNVIRDYFNLNIAEQLNRYNGTVLLIRRTDDEILCTPSNTLSGNRGNMLLTKLLMRRYPHLFSEASECAALLSRFLSVEVSAKRAILDAVNVDEKSCLQLIAEERDANGAITYPSELGKYCYKRTKQQLTLFLATMYMKDQPSSHCAPLAVDLFQPGWNPAETTIEK